MSENFGEKDERNAMFEMMSYEGVSEIVDFGSFNTGDTEISLDSCSDISD